MKGPVSNQKVARSAMPLSATLPHACLLLLASLLAIAGGIATATLFFGMLLLFALLVCIIRPNLGAEQEEDAS